MLRRSIPLTRRLAIGGSLAIVALIAHLAEPVGALPTVTFQRVDTTTQGNRCAIQRTYGTYAYMLPLAGHDERAVGGNEPFHPAQPVLDETGGPGFGDNTAPAPHVGYTVHGPQESEDVRALENPAATQRRPGAHTGTNFAITLNLPNGNYLISTYLLDWDLDGRIQTTAASAGAGSTTVVTTNAINGVYERYIVNVNSGSVTFTFAGSSPNAVVSGIFVDAYGSPATGVTHESTDTTTQGNWVGNYGGLGYALLGSNGTTGSTQPWKASLDTAAGDLVGSYTSTGLVYDFADAYNIGTYTGNAYEHSLSDWLPRLTGDQRAQEFFKYHPEVNGPLALGDRRQTVWDNGGDIPINAASRALDDDITLPSTPIAGDAYQLALYFADFETTARQENVTVTDLTHGIVIDGPRLISNFNGGIYELYRVPGNISLRIEIDRVAGINSVLSGVFLDQVPAGSPAFIGTDTTTGSAAKQQCAFGNFAYVTPDAKGPSEMPIGGNDPSHPASPNLDEAGGPGFGDGGYTGELASYSVHGPLTVPDRRALETPDGSQRRAAAVYGTTSVVSVLLPSGTWNLSLYSVDWDRDGRVQSTVIDGHTHGSASHTSDNSLPNGVYDRYVVPSDGVNPTTVTVKLLGGPNAVLSGIFVDPAAAASSVAYLSSDSATAGNWVGAYGSSGYALFGFEMSPTNSAGFTSSWAPHDDLNSGALTENDATARPPYVVTSGGLYAWTPFYSTAAAIQNAFAFAWTDFFASSGDARALQFFKFNPNVPGPPVLGDRRATTWDSGDEVLGPRPLNVDLHVPANSSASYHSFKLALYSADWDNNGRNETISIVDTASNTVLDSRTISPGSGTWLIWSVPASTNLTIRASANAGINAVIGGITLDEVP